MWNFFFTILWWINSYIFEHIFETKILLQYKCLYCHFLSNQSINLWICEIHFHSSLKIKPYSSLTWLGFKGTHKLATWLAERDQVHWWLCGGGKQMGGVWGEAKLTGWAEYLWNFGYLKEGKQKKKTMSVYYFHWTFIWGHQIFQNTRTIYEFLYHASKLCNVFSCSSVEISNTFVMLTLLLSQCSL